MLLSLISIPLWFDYKDVSFNKKKQLSICEVDRIILNYVIKLTVLWII